MKVSITIERTGMEGLAIGQAADIESEIAVAARAILEGRYPGERRTLEFETIAEGPVKVTEIHRRGSVPVELFGK